MGACSAFKTTLKESSAAEETAAREASDKAKAEAEKAAAAAAAAAAAERARLEAEEAAKSKAGLEVRCHRALLAHRRLCVWASWRCRAHALTRCENNRTAFRIYALVGDVAGLASTHVLAHSHSRLRRRVCQLCIFLPDAVS